MTRVLPPTTRDPTLSTTSVVVGSFNDDRSYAMRLASSDTSCNTNATTTAFVSPYLLRHTLDLPDIRSPTPTPFTGPSTPGSSVPSSPATVHKVPGVAGRGGVTVRGGGGLVAASINGAITPVAEEMHHPGNSLCDHNSLTESRTTSDSDASLTRVDLRDLGEDSHNFTTNTLRKCKLQVLRPYWGLLMFIGWRAFRHDVIYPRSCLLRTLNIIYPVLVILFLFYTYVYEMVACEWKLDVVKDTVIQTTPKPHPRHNHTHNHTGWVPISDLLPAEIDLNSSDGDQQPRPCDHIVVTYLIPNLLHFVAYVTGLYYFRIQDNEQMYAMMEKVFLQANPLHTGSSSQQKLVFKTRLFLVFGALWVSATLGLQALYVWAFDFPALAFFKEFGMEVHWITFSVELAGRVIFNSVILAVVMNYATQCEMVMFYVKGLALRLQEKSTDIKTAFKDTWLLRQSLSLLNGVMSKMTSLVLFLLAELTVIGISILIRNRCDVPKVWAYRSLFPLIWGVMLCFPLFQAARVNSVCLRIKKTCLEMRVFGYKNSSQLDLDSFLQFVHHTSLRAKLFSVPIQPSYLLAVLILGTFIILLLVQTTTLLPNNDFI